MTDGVVKGTTGRGRQVEKEYKSSRRVENVVKSKIRGRRKLEEEKLRNRSACLTLFDLNASEAQMHNDVARLA